MTVLFERMAVVGLGLLGGSAAVAARERGVVGSVVGAARRPEPLARALARGIVDEVLPAREAVRHADLVLLATPVNAMAEVLRDVAQEIEPGALVTDVGSVKGHVARELPGLLPAGVHFVGSHPMAGSHEIGVDHARADLFEEACCVVTPVRASTLGAEGQPEGLPEAHAELENGPLARLTAFWEALGARVVVRDPVVHDLEVAWVSHLPHALAFAYGHALANAPTSALDLVGSGFHDFVRIAKSDSELWADILGKNGKSLAKPLKEFGRALDELAGAIEADDTAAQQKILASAARQLSSAAEPARKSSGESSHAGPGEPSLVASEGWDGQTEPPEPKFDARSGGVNPEIQAAPREAATRSVNRDT